MYRAVFLNIYQKMNDYKNNNNKPNVLVIGNGWSGNSFCKSLDKSKFNLTIIDKNDYFLETHKMSSKYNPIKQITIPNSHFIQDEVQEINTANNQVILTNGIINYDYLIFALGSEVNTFNILGVDKHCMFYKNREDLHKTKQLFNKDIAVIGGGVTGIELAYKLYKNNPNLEIIEALDILPNYSENTKNKIKKDLASKNIKLYNRHRATEIRPIEQTDFNKYEITLDNHINNFSKQYDNIIWTAGIKRHSLKPEVSENVFVIGDNSKVNPPTAQKAKQEGRWLAKYFNNDFNEKFQNFEFKEKGKIIHTDNGLYIEITNNSTIWLPECFNWLIYKLIDWM